MATVSVLCRKWSKVENYFAQQKNLSKAEIEWIEKLNRLGMRYLSVFVEDLIRKQDLTANERIRVLQAMERYPSFLVAENFWNLWKRDGISSLMRNNFRH